MAEAIPLVELEFSIAALPPLAGSAGAHPLFAPDLHARRLVDLWRVEDDVPLSQAFRLLDRGAIAGAILRTRMAQAAGLSGWTIPELGKLWDDAANLAPPKDSDTRGDPACCPSLAALLPELQETVWQDILDGTLLVEAVKWPHGRRHAVVSLIELQRLRPDWSVSRLMLDGRDQYVDARVGLAPSVPVKRSWRARPSEVDVKREMSAIEKDYAPDACPTFDEIWQALKTRLGEDFPRDQARKALDYAPRLRGGRGRSRKSKIADLNRGHFSSPRFGDWCAI
jgi:hypothetical protein